jgi:hypothetical protein
MEVCAQSYYLLVHGGMFPSDEFKAKMIVIAKHEPPSENTGKSTSGELAYCDYTEVVHPYLGYVRDPNRSVCINNWCPVSNFGFADTHEPLVKRSREALNIAIFGGSFAEQFATMANEPFIRELQVHGKKIVLRNYALASYKQPQQLMALTYLLSLGAEFDIVINIDGFNEIVGPITDNLAYNIFPTFPRAWSSRVAQIQSPEDLRMIGEMSLIEKRRQNLAGFLLDVNLNRSALISLLWDNYDTRLRRARGRIAHKIETAQAKAESRFVATGPKFGGQGEGDAVEFCSRFWQQCSIQMSRLCEANGIKYYHFLQPNQYVAGSKIILAKERKQAVDESHNYARCVVKGYPVLRSKGTELSALGIQFHDLTQIFSDNDEVLYEDTCCHLNARGYRYIASAVSATINRDFVTPIAVSSSSSQFSEHSPGKQGINDHHSSSH